MLHSYHSTWECKYHPLWYFPYGKCLTFVIWMPFWHKSVWFLMQSLPWKNITSLFVLRCQEVEAGWPQLGLLEVHDPLAATARLSLAEVHSRAGMLLTEWNRRENETRNTDFQWVFTDVYWQQRSKETSLGSEPKRECVLMVLDLCSCSQLAQLPLSSSPVPASPPSPFHSSLPAHGSFIATHALAPASSILTPCTNTY